MTPLPTPTPSTLAINTTPTRTVPWRDVQEDQLDRLWTPLPTTTPVPESEWTLYRNEVFGFTIRYPARWEVAENSISLSTGHLLDIWWKSNDPIDPHPILRIWSLAEPTTAVDYGSRYAANQKQSRESYLLEFEDGETAIGGIPAYEFRYCIRSLCSKEVFIVDGDILFDFRIGDHPNIFFRNEILVEEILHSFKLVAQPG